jgi:hypothetical protein
MRSIRSHLPNEILRHIGADIGKSLGCIHVASKNAFPVRSFSEFVKISAKISFLNKDYLLFYRGQAQDYVNRAGRSTIYPSIYRDDYVSQIEVKHRFDVLDGACKILKEKFTEGYVDGLKELKRKKYVQWSILQHYDVCPTPFLDVSHSLRVACSFALHNAAANQEAYVYVFGLPYITNRITINSEHDLISVRLLSICPPDALRPYYQEGYLVGTDDITYDYDRKGELDFANRLIAKFVIPNNINFWGRGFQQIPFDSLCPKDDPIESLCAKVKELTDSDFKTGDVGAFLLAWSELEEALINKSKQISNRMLSVRSATNILFENHQIPEELMREIDKIRKFRNIVVHSPKAIDIKDVQSGIDQIKHLKSKIGLKKRG